MSGSYPDTAAQTIAADAATAAAGVVEATARNAKRQAESAAFIVEHGAAVNGGHSVVDTIPPELTGNE